MVVIYILSRDIGYAQSAHSLPLLLRSVADLPINTETLSSMTKHTHTHTHWRTCITYANVCLSRVCVCMCVGPAKHFGQVKRRLNQQHQLTSSTDFHGAGLFLPTNHMSMSVCLCVCVHVYSCVQH